MKRKRTTKRIPKPPKVTLKSQREETKRNWQMIAPLAIADEFINVRVQPQSKWVRAKILWGIQCETNYGYTTYLTNVMREPPFRYCDLSPFWACTRVTIEITQDVPVAMRGKGDRVTLFFQPTDFRNVTLANFWHPRGYLFESQKEDICWVSWQADDWYRIRELRTCLPKDLLREVHEFL